GDAVLGKDLPSLAEKYKDKFIFGAFVSQVFYKDAAEAGSNHWVSPQNGESAEDLYLKQFNQSTTGNSLKPESAHPYAPSWLAGDPKIGVGFTDIEDMRKGKMSNEYNFDIPDFIFKKAVENNLFIHGHSLAWFQQSAAWFARMVPQGITGTDFNANGNFITYGVLSNSGANTDLNGLSGMDAVGKIQVDKNTARRVLFDHIVHEMRHYSTVDPEYIDKRSSSIGSPGAEPAGSIYVYSWDVLNEEIRSDGGNADWKLALRNTSWLRAMTGDEWDSISSHYVYLLYKFAHIAIPNQAMVEKFAANYGSLPDYMKAHGDSSNGDLSKYIQKINGEIKTPVLYYNDYNLNQSGKATAAADMIEAVNHAWLSDPLFDGRPLIEGIGMQAHYTSSPALLSQVRSSLEKFEALTPVNGIPVKIAISELDMKSNADAPGGKPETGSGVTTVPWTQLQNDAQGYQFALLFKLFIEHADHIERITMGGLEDRVNWLWARHGHTVLFNEDMEANSAYYAAYDPDRFMKKIQAETPVISDYLGKY
ncbi:MAG: endo-1,4-beta-xylanase, partial [Treponema sp.]|nr:endo-1,4-beta-xylanase [Treponema sp.]